MQASMFFFFLLLLVSVVKLCQYTTKDNEVVLLMFSNVKFRINSVLDFPRRMTIELHTVTDRMNPPRMHQRSIKL